MTTYPFMQVDAFTDNALGGNPCAVIFDVDNFDDEIMLRVAQEMNLSETAFVISSVKADFGARYFTPAEEIPLAGHPTIATVFALVDSDRLKLKGDFTTISLELIEGPIRVDIQSKNGKVIKITMSQRKPQFLKIYEPAEVLPLLNLFRDDLLPGMPVQTVSTGTPQLMIPLRDHDALRRAQMNFEKYKKFQVDADFFSPHLFCLKGITDRGRTFARYLSAPPDVIEDPFTGSATGGMAAYLWHYGLIEEPSFIAEQGHWMNRPGYAFVEVVGPRDNIKTVKVGGSAVTVIRGELMI